MIRAALIPIAMFGGIAAVHFSTVNAYAMVEHRPGLGDSAGISFDTQEDDPAWSCVDMGNRICGPGNSEGKPAACYDDGGVIVALWPCHVVVNRDGSSDVYEG